MAARRVKPIPEGYHNLTPILVVAGGAKAIDFYKKTLGAQEVFRMDMPDGKVGHAELTIGDSRLMLSDEWPDMGARSPKHYGGSPSSLNLYVDDCDAVVKHAVAGGATLQRPVQDQFYGDRSGTIVDPFGHIWHIATHIEDVPPDEMKRRSDAWLKKNASS